MPRLTVKSSTIFISVGGKTQVYRSVEDVPPHLRKRLEQSTNGINSATILIADRRGREEIVRAIRGFPSSVRSRLSSTLGGETEPRLERPQKAPEFWQNWAEMLMPSAIGIVVWLLFSLR